MKASKLVISALSTAALAGTITLANAQGNPNFPDSVNSYSSVPYNTSGTYGSPAVDHRFDERDPTRQASSVNSRIDNYGSNLRMPNDGSNFKDDGFAPGNAAIENTLGR